MFSNYLDDRNMMAQSIVHFGHFWLSTEAKTDVLQNNIKVID
jgi:hypothetical protein